MPSRKHVDILNNGVKAWNKWRKENPEIKPNLTKLKRVRSKLNGVDFSNTNLQDANFSYCGTPQTKN
jgi:uncharacterized protein YjbI with pentapeptide repeats